MLGAFAAAAKERLELREGEFDGIEIGAGWWQVGSIDVSSSRRSGVYRYRWRLGG